MLKTIKDWILERAVNDITGPLTNQIDENITDITTTIGSFIIRKVRDKFQRSISFTIGTHAANDWMEEALYGIIYENNKLENMSKLELYNKNGYTDGAGMYYRLDDGVHNLRYRQFNILLVIQTKAPQQNYRTKPVRIYTVITYDLSPEFIKLFEADVLRHRNSLLKIRADVSTVEVWRDLHEQDGYTYWEKMTKISKRSLKSIYIPHESKKKIVDTVNAFFTNKKFYIEHGIPWNLKILLYGPMGTGKSSIVKMIASEWNRNIYECTGGKNGKFIPDAITDNAQCIVAPLFSISDIDKYSFLINEPEIKDLDNDAKDDKLAYKQSFGNMINALDGILTGQGRIIVMTTNNIHKFSPVFLRPGRVDLLMEIGYVVPEVFRKYVYDFYGKILPKDIKLNRDNITVAELQQDVVFCKMKFEDFVEKYTKPLKKKASPEKPKGEKNKQ